MPTVILPAGHAPPVGVTLDTGARTPLGSLADDIDPSTGELLRLVGKRHPVDAAVIHVVRTVRNSGPAVAGVGQAIQAIGNIGNDFNARFEAELRRALAPLVADERIRILEIRTEAQGDMGAGLVRYRNLLTGREERATT